MLKIIIQEVYGRYGDLIQQYEVSLSRMLNDILFRFLFWSLTNSDFPTDHTLQKFHGIDTELDFHRIMSGYREHLQRLWHDSKERLPIRTPGSVPLLGACLCSNCWNQIPRTCHVFRHYYVSVLQKLTGYRRIPCQEWVSPRGVSRAVKRTFLTGDSPIPCQFL